MVRDAARSLWNEPRAPDPPPRAVPDLAFVGALVTLATFEALFRDHVTSRPLALLLGAAPVLTLLWRRSHPLAAVAVAYAAHVAVHLAPIFGHHHDESSLYATVFVLLLPYSLLRWGSGRESVIGIVIILGTHGVTGAEDAFTAVEAVAGAAILLLPAALGASVRYRTVSRVREIDQIRLRERAQLARELHDTVAHHVSAIAIQAQAGRTVAAAEPDAAITALRIIEAEASRTLTEMRAMVGALRQGEEAAFAPQKGVADLAALAGRTGTSPTVEVAPSGNLDDLTPAVDAAVYRLAQESITNALRHARRATSIRVTVSGEPRHVRLTVSDDGDPGPTAPTALATGAGAGYGIVGMTERAALLGGTLHAGPNRGRGWTVTAVLPRTGVAT